MNILTGDVHASTLFGSPDRPDAWEKAEKLGGPDDTVMAIWKGDFAKEVCTKMPQKE